MPILTLFNERGFTGTDGLGLPAVPGVYAIMKSVYGSKRAEVVYIGSSNNIKKRVYGKNHVYRKLISSTTFPTLIYPVFKPTNDFIETEKCLIKKYKPIYNYNNKNHLVSLG
jgi:excinuclease UvrABC nuclease subunit